MATLNGIDYTTNTAVFSVSNDGDMSNLPTTTASGVDHKGTKLSPVAPGSFAYLTDGSSKTYVLDGNTNTWKERQ